MASISKDRDRDGKHNGCRTIQFTDGEGKRRSVRLGKVTQRQADTIRGHVESIISANFSGDSYDRPTAEWLGRIDQKFRDKLAAAGLVAKQVKAVAKALGPFIDAYISTRQSLKPATLAALKYAGKCLVEFLGENTKLSDVTEGDADLYREHARKRLSENSVRPDCGRARQFFHVAVKQRLIDKNPFGEMKNLGPLTEQGRARFISREDIDKVLEHCRDAEFRLIVALARYGGLRVPTEPLAMKWGDVDWERERLTVRCVKTEHIEGKAVRVVPIFPEIMPHLEAVYDAASDGAEFVITKHRTHAKTLRRRLEAACKRAGVETWPKPFHNLRGTRETELVEQFPPHVVCKWIGHDITVSAKHYLQITDEHFDRALQKCMQPTAATASHTRT